MKVPFVAFALVASLVAGLLAGCAGDGDGDGDPAPPAPRLPAGVQMYDGNGTKVPVTQAAVDALGTPAWNNSGFEGGEPNMGVLASGRILVSAFELVIASDDNGTTWHEVYDFRVPVLPVDPFFNSDPMLWVDPVTDVAYDAPMYPTLACVALAVSEDQGETWTQRPPSCPALQPFDRQTVSSGLPGPSAPPLAGVAHPTVLYVCYNQLLTTACMVSYDGGLTFPVDQPVWTSRTAPAGSEGCAGQNGHPMAAPVGTIVVPKSWFCDGLFVAVSADNGLTWDIRTGPQVGGDTLSPEVAFTPDGTMYALWQGADHLTYLARSPDMGLSWEHWVVSPPEVRSTVFAGFSAGDDGRVAMAFLGTDDTDAYPSDADDDTVWHLYVVTSDNANATRPTFVSYQVTPKDDPVQVGCVWIGGGGSPCRNMLDFIDTGILPDGRFVVAYADGCLACSVASESRARDASVARLDGWLLRTPASQ